MSAVLLGAIYLVLRRRQPNASPPAAAPSRAELEELVRLEAQAQGVAPSLALAIVDTENAGWNPAAVNQGPGDAGRGGAWGLFQLTATTARSIDDAHGRVWAGQNPDRPASDLADLPLALRLSVAGLADLARAAARTFPVGSTPWARDVASRWNSGKPEASAPASTRLEYLPRFSRRYAARVEQDVSRG